MLAMARDIRGNSSKWKWLLSLLSEQSGSYPVIYICLISEVGRAKLHAIPSSTHAMFIYLGAFSAKLADCLLLFYSRVTFCLSLMSGVRILYIKHHTVLHYCITFSYHLLLLALSSSPLSLSLSLSYHLSLSQPLIPHFFTFILLALPVSLFLLPLPVSLFFLPLPVSLFLLPLPVSISPPSPSLFISPPSPSLFISPPSPCLFISPPSPCLYFSSLSQSLYFFSLSQSLYFFSLSQSLYFSSTLCEVYLQLVLSLRHSLSTDLSPALEEHVLLSIPFQ